MRTELFILSPTYEREGLHWAGSGRFESITCPQFPQDHQRPGRRIGPLAVVQPDDAAFDVMWSCYRECIVSVELAARLQREGVSGLSLDPATLHVGREGRTVRAFELRITGWGGMADPRSGIRLLESCDSCGLKVYSSFTHAGALVRPGAWDGSDFFIVWPLPRFILLSPRAAQFLKSSGASGFRLDALESLPPEPDETLTPGLLEYYMPAELAAGRMKDIEA